MNFMESKKDKVRFFFKDKLNILALIVIIFGIMIRVYYLFLAANQTLWWDEAELMLQAKHIAFGFPNTGWFPYREPLLPLIWGFIFKMGASEFFIRLFEFLFSITALIFTYLLSKEIFGKKEAIVATFLLSIFYLHIFYSLRFMSEAPTLAFVTMAVYFFWRGYFSEKKSFKLLLLAGLSIAIGFLSYYAVGFIALIFLIFLIIIERFRFLKVKKLWIVFIIIAILLMPYFIYSMVTVGAPIPRLAAVKESITNPETTKLYSAWSYYIGLFPTYLQDIAISNPLSVIPFMPTTLSVLFLVFLVGVIYFLINIVIGFDLILKNSNEGLKRILFLLLWILIPIIILSYIAINTGGHGEDRYLMIIFPAVFLIASRFLIIFTGYLNKVNDKLGITFLILILLIIGYGQIAYADQLVKLKSKGINSYEPVKQAGLWIRENSKPGDVVISNSIPQNTYYSERATYYAFEDEKIKSYKPKYFVVSVFENSGEKYFKYPDEHKSELVPVQAYFADKEQKNVVLVIYEFNYVAKRSSS